MILKDFIIENDCFSLGAKAKSWEEAVKIGVDLLVKAGAAEERYYDGVLKIARTYGPYYVIAPGIAMPHARPEEGALKTGFALVTLERPVRFGHSDNDPVDIVLCICAKNKEDLNKEAIVNAVTLFDEDRNIDRLRRAKTKEDIVAILNDVEKANS